MNKKVLFVLIPLIVVIVAAIGVLTFMLFNTPSANDLYLERIESAQRSLEEGNVDQAILYYKQAIEKDDTQEEPYLKLAKIYYERQDDIGSALGILYQGYQKISSSSEIQAAIRYYEGLLSSEGAEKQATDGQPVNSGGNYIDENLSNAFSTYTFLDYSNRYTLKNVDRTIDFYSVSYTQLDGVFEYTNNAGQARIIDPDSGVPYPTARPTAIRLNNLEALIPEISKGISKEQLESYGVESITQNSASGEITTDYLTFVYKNCLYKVECDENGIIKNANGYCCIVPPANAVVNLAVLSGTVLSAADSSLVQDVTLNFREGTNVESGSIYTSVTSSDGSYSVELEAGSYTVEVAAEGYITEFFGVEVSDLDTEISKTFVISPELSGKQMRFVVEWVNPQYDLYIHIKGNSTDNNYVNYWEARYSSSGDVDKNLGGFEQGTRDGKRFTSATILDSTGTYEFHVHGGNDLYQPQDIINAGATVKIYKDNNSAPIIVDLPSAFSSAGLYWVVCRVHDGEITYIDT